jgi:hypothetical protein
MSDTTQEAAARYEAMLMALTPQERLRKGCEMFSAARVLAIAGIRAEQGDLDERELRKKLFLRLYDSDFTDEEKARILAAL